MAGTVDKVETVYTNLQSHIMLMMHPPYNSSKIIAFLVAGVKFVEQFKELDGVRKKDIVLRAIRDTIASSDDIPDSEKESILAIFDVVGDSAINTLVDFGTTFVNKGKNSKKFCGLC
jgi:hypothetical protein